MRIGFPTPSFRPTCFISSISGYHSIRLCDNIADNDGPLELRKLIPSTLYFDSEAISPYRKYFPTIHEFWTSFNTFLAQQADASAADSFLEDVDEETFASLSSRKFTGTKIPMSAVRHRYQGVESEVEQWLQFVDCIGNFAQFSNDFFDWRHDLKHGIITYVSSEARRRAHGDSITTWFLREGFDWGVEGLKSRFHSVRLCAEMLGNEEVLHWTVARGRTLDDDIGNLDSALKLLRTLDRITSDQKP